ncbi:hypothetical protein [Microbacterium telephonicum]|uniref:hypothetical protein n=1 Tax=Microbacterium telephonicum TaxID=1714841 RepID=UPI001F54442B|nr:hypothetical protein [Microbacterium telephonicum]
MAQVDVVFLSDWLIETGEELLGEHRPPAATPASGDLLCQLVPSGPAYTTENNLRLFLSLIHGATERVIINAEMSMMVRGRSFVAAMREVEQHYRDAGRELTLEEWRRGPAKATFLDGVARLTSALN